MLMTDVVGMDPEVFIRIQDKVVPASVYFPDKTKQIECSTGSTSRDGWALELRPKPGRPRQVVKNLEILFREARLHIVEQGVAFNDIVFLPNATLNISPQTDFTTLPPDLQQFGCEPSFDAYEAGAPINVKINATEHFHRYAGGHLHFCLGEVIGNQGFPNVASKYYRELLTLVHKGKDVEARAKVSPLVQLFDYTIGLFLASQDFPPNFERQRRNYYGLPGEFRLQIYNKQCLICKDALCPTTAGSAIAIKKFLKLTGIEKQTFTTTHKQRYQIGIEYRTPSANILRNNALILMAFALGREVLHSGRHPEQLLKQYQTFAAAFKPESVRKLIRDNHSFYARELLASMTRDTAHVLPGYRSLTWLLNNSFVTDRVIFGESFPSVYQEGF